MSVQGAQESLSTVDNRGRSRRGIEVPFGLCGPLYGRGSHSRGCRMEMNERGWNEMMRERVRE